ncbi:MAG TPA: hypothetical protein DCY74_05465 [Clostridiales bacterium]|nr:hypothetical protein [Clostridiales bacterium]HBE13601.1 hypothetical protein [Clostridiales bacterium]HCG36494.1 hypothetical protein [Clostridiales bacterium]
MNELFEAIAIQEGVSEEEVRNEIIFAIQLAMTDPELTEIWDAIGEGQIPTPEQLVEYLSCQIH